MNLYRIEWMKIRSSSYLRAVFGIFMSLLALGILFLFIFQIEAEGSGASEEAELFANWNGLLSLTTALAFSCFSVLAAAIAAKVIISEYCGANAVFLLSYPVRRRAMLRIKCLLVIGITTVSALISNTLVIGVMYLLACIFGIMPQMDTEYFALTVLFSSLLMGILSSAVGIIAAAFGWRKRSSVSAIVCSLLIVCALANCITIFPARIIWVMLAICGGFTAAADLIYHILENGIEKMEV